VTSTTALSEHDSKQLLAAHGVPVSTEHHIVDPDAVRAADAAAAAAEDVGYPCVVKLCGAAITHKTEIGGVRLGLTSPDAVRSAASELLAAGPAGAELLVAEQVRGNRELIAGVTTDAQFGRSLMFGIGGVLAEVLADVVFRLLPATRAEIASMLDDLEHPAFLDPFRGEPAVDREALVDALCGLADAVAQRDDIESVDVNPMIVRDGRPVAVDALVVLR